MSKSSIDKKMQEINRIQLEIRREKIRKRKARTHRLIQKGALLEKYFGLQNTSVEETEEILKKLSNKLKKSQR